MRNDEAIQNRIVEGRQFMDIGVIGGFPPTERCLRPQLLGKIVFVQITQAAGFITLMLIVSGIKISS